jgi:crossover junction endodeoxyribonuclease RuvC
MATMVILGIDPGTATIGYGVIETARYQAKYRECGTIQTSSGTDLSTRLSEIGADIAALLQEVQPDLCVVEELFFFRNVTNAMSVAHARGVILYQIAQAKIKLLELTPLQMKKAVTGLGKASKNQVGKMIKTMLHLDAVPTPDDAADALGLALAGYMATRNDK